MMDIVDVLVVCAEVYVALLALETCLHYQSECKKSTFLIKNYHFIGICGSIKKICKYHFFLDIIHFILHKYAAVIKHFLT